MVGCRGIEPAPTAEIRSTGGRIARYSQMADPPCRPQRLSRQEADLNAANAGATHASHGWPWKATQGLRGAGTAQRNAAAGASLVRQAPRHYLAGLSMWTWPS